MTGDVFQLIGSFFKVLKHYSHNEITAFKASHRDPVIISLWEAFSTLV